MINPIAHISTIRNNKAILLEWFPLFLIAALQLFLFYDLHNIGKQWRMCFGLLLVSTMLYLVKCARSNKFPAMSRQSNSLLLVWIIYYAIIIFASAIGNTFNSSDSAKDFEVEILISFFIPLFYILFVGNANRLKLVIFVFSCAAILMMADNLVAYIDEIIARGKISNNIAAHRSYYHPLVFGAPFILLSFFTSQSPISRAIWLVLILLCTIMVVLTGSRGAWLAYIAILIFFIIMMRSYKLFIITITSIALSFFLLYIFYPESFVITKFLQGFNTSGRTTGTWLPAIDMFAERPLFGYGFGMDVFHNEFNSVVGNYPEWTFKKSRSPHSYFLFTLFCVGIVGFAALLYLIWRSFSLIVSILRQHENMKSSFVFTSGVTLLALILGYLVVHGLFEDRKPTHVSFAFALCIAWLNVAGQNNKACNEPKPVIAQ